MALTQIVVGREFTFSIPNTRTKGVEGNFSGSPVSIRFVGENKAKVNKLELNGNTLNIVFDQSESPRKPLIAIIDEAVQYSDIEKPNNLREEIAASYKKLSIPFAMTSNALTFDHSHYTRGIGQIQIAENLERNHGKKLADTFDLHSGMGFGSIISAYVALGRDLGELKKWWAKDLRRAVKTSTLEIITGRKGTFAIKRAIKRLFADDAKRPYLMSDLQSRLVLYTKDANGVYITVDSKIHTTQKVHEVISSLMFDPREFRTKPEFKGHGLLLNCFNKSPNAMLRAGNNHLKITSICSPVRVYDHGNRKRSIENLSMISTESSYQQERMQGGLGIKFYECKPIDHIKKYDTSRKGLATAIHSVDGVL